MIKYLLLILTLAPTLAFADLGDTLESSRLKYGDPVHSSPETHVLSYVHNGCQIDHTYNDVGVCVVAEFSRLDRQNFSIKVIHHLDQANLPPMTINMQGNGWVQSKWPDTDNMRNMVSYIWTNRITYFQVLGGQTHYDNGDVGWRWTRTYLCPEGVELIKALNAGQPGQDSNPNQKTNI